jgi:pRiA4b ORF-3-like protein
MTDSTDEQPKMPSKKKAQVSKDRAFQLKVQIAAIEPEIWRRIVVPPTLTLRELHAVIQGAMGWQDCHLHAFEIGGKRFEVPDRAGGGPEDECEDERTWTLNSVLSKGMTFVYVYDFGDNWRHLVTVEDIIDPKSKIWLPLCIAGQRACPPEDCGGVYGYPAFLEALASPQHPEHENMMTWGRGFEPERFNITQANALIGAIRALYHERHWGFRTA